MKETEISTITGRRYYLSDIVRIVNPRQCMLYIKNNIYPVDLYTSNDEKTGNDILVMLFDRKESQPLYEKWKNHELN